MSMVDFGSNYEHIVEPKSGQKFKDFLSQKALPILFQSHLGDAKMLPSNSNHWSK